MKTLDCQKLDVTDKTRSNMLGWRGRSRQSSFDNAEKVLQNHEHEN